PTPRLLLLDLAEAGEAALEARQTAAAVGELLRAAGPGRMRVRVDVEVERLPRFAKRRAGGELLTIGHDDLDHVIGRVDIGFHGSTSDDNLGQQKRAARGAPAALVWRRYNAGERPIQAARDNAFLDSTLRV